MTNSSGVDAHFGSSTSSMTTPSSSIPNVNWKLIQRYDQNCFLRTLITNTKASQTSNETKMTDHKVITAKLRFTWRRFKHDSVEKNVSLRAPKVHMKYVMTHSSTTDLVWSLSLRKSAHLNLVLGLITDDPADRKKTMWNRRSNMAPIYSSSLPNFD